MKQRIWSVIKIAFSLVMIFAGMLHIIKPNVYLPILPSFIPFRIAVIYISGLVEILIGVLLLLNSKYAKIGAFGFLWLMIFFLPIHILDALAEQPAIGSQTIAYIRIVVQFVIIALAWKLNRVLATK